MKRFEINYTNSRGKKVTMIKLAKNIDQCFRILADYEINFIKELF
jgi:hypothetical protein